MYQFYHSQSEFVTPVGKVVRLKYLEPEREMVPLGRYKYFLLYAYT